MNLGKIYFVDDRIMKLREVKCFGQGLTASEWWGLGLRSSAYPPKPSHTGTCLSAQVQNNTVAPLKDHDKERSWS